MKVRVQSYRPVRPNDWLCVVCVNIGSSWVINRLPLQVYGFGTVFVLDYVLWTVILAFQRTSERTFISLGCSAL